MTHTVVPRLARFFRLSVRELTALFLLFALSLPAVTLRLYASDEVQYYAYLRSLWFDRDVSFDNEYRHLYEAGVARSTLFSKTFIEPATDTGLRRNFATVGSAILWSPFYAIADVSVRGARAFGNDTPADGYSKPYVAAVCLGSAVYGFLAILLSVRMARELTGSGLRAGLAVWLGTPLLFYMYVAPAFGHATSAFAVALFVTIWLKVRRNWSPRGVAALAAAGALMTMVREQDAFLAIGAIVDFLVGLHSTVRETRASGRTRLGVGSVALFGLALATFLIVLAPQLVAYRALNGRFSPSPLVSRKMTWFSPHGLEVVLSPEHGFFFWTPLAAVALAGLVVLALSGSGREPGSRFAQPRQIAVSMLVMAAATVYVTGSVESWTAAGAFGQRRFVNLTPLLIVGVAALFARARIPPGPMRAAGRGLVAVIALCVWWNVALITQFGAHMMDRQRLELRRNARTAFITLPVTGPRLLYRYFFDRRSFYRTEPPR